MLQFYENQKKEEKRRKSPRRVLGVAARFLDVDQFYLPCYFDNRLRIYYTVDTISPNGSDFQKALLMFADGLAVTPANKNEVKRDLLITIANTWANKVTEWTTSSQTSCPWMTGEVAEDFIKELEGVARDPLTTASKALWTAASEPFQFLAVVREYFEVIVWGRRPTPTWLMDGTPPTPGCRSWALCVVTGTQWSTPT